MKSTCFVFKLKRKKQVLALVLIEDLGFLPLVREIQRLSTRSATLHSWKDGISHTRGRNPRSSIGTRVRTYYSLNTSIYNQIQITLIYQELPSVLLTVWIMTMMCWEMSMYRYLVSLLFYCGSLCFLSFPLLLWLVLGFVLLALFFHYPNNLS
jgi:hypothetical protein